MKTAIYIEDGMTQIVVTPETEFDKAALKSLRDHEMTATVRRGSFYQCRGRWERHAESDDSLIVRVTAERKP